MVLSWSRLLSRLGLGVKPSIYTPFLSLSLWSGLRQLFILHSVPSASPLAWGLSYLFLPHAAVSFHAFTSLLNASLNTVFVLCLQSLPDRGLSHLFIRGCVCYLIASSSRLGNFYLYLIAIGRNPLRVGFSGMFIGILSHYLAPSLPSPRGWGMAAGKKEWGKVKVTATDNKRNER